jgi:hypothetical protein
MSLVISVSMFVASFEKKKDLIMDIIKEVRATSRKIK